MTILIDCECDGLRVTLNPVKSGRLFMMWLTSFSRPSGSAAFRGTRAVSASLGLLLLAFVLCAVSAIAAADEFQLMKSEQLGTLKVGMQRGAALKILGTPSKSGKIEEWGADGMFHQQLELRSAGITLGLVSKSKGSTQTVESITAVAPCQLATAAGIRLGNTESDVVKAYRRHYNKEESTPGSFVVAGSIYGGITFQIKKGRVSQIFIGASSE